MIAAKNKEDELERVKVSNFYPLFEAC